MQEPTHRQHMILESVQTMGNSIQKSNTDPDMDLYWELARAGYLKDFVTMSKGFDWSFELTEKGESYLKSFN